MGLRECFRLVWLSQNHCLAWAEDLQMVSNYHTFTEALRNHLSTTADFSSFFFIAIVLVLSGPGALYRICWYKGRSISVTFSLGHLVFFVGIGGILINSLPGGRGNNSWYKQTMVFESSCVGVPSFLVSWEPAVRGCISFTKNSMSQVLLEVPKTQKIILTFGIGLAHRIGKFLTALLGFGLCFTFRDFFDLLLRVSVHHCLLCPHLFNFSVDPWRLSMMSAINDAVNLLTLACALHISVSRSKFSEPFLVDALVPFSRLIRFMYNDWSSCL